MVRLAVTTTSTGNISSNRTITSSSPTNRERELGLDRRETG